jgi:(p)ppGpp synthase/HD superfamily hydrolase
MAKHDGQLDKNEVDYIYHPLRVACEVATRTGGDERMVAAALLHDVIEDTDATYNDVEMRFGLGVANLVLVLTYDKEKETYFEYIARVTENEGARRIKVCDVLDNLREPFPLEPRMWVRYKNALKMLGDDAGKGEAR